MQKSLLLLSVYLIILAFSSCTFRRVTRETDITYLAAKPNSNQSAQRLDVYRPANEKTLKDVLLFIHGGNWNSGGKNLYKFFGNRWARKDVVTVVVEYPLSPQASYKDMAVAVANAVKWTQQNIQQHGGNPERIFLSGHSAGGHLAALLTIQPAYLQEAGVTLPLKGAILIDAAGLDMYTYLIEENFAKDHTYLKTFTQQPEEWKAASPLYQLHANMPPLLLYRGGDTYPSIEKSTERFVSALKQYVPSPNYHVLKGKNHIPMITQFFWSWNPRYKEMKRFMQEAR